MTRCFFVTDIHGRTGRYDRLFNLIKTERPDVVFFGGDLLPHGHSIKSGVTEFINAYLVKNLESLRDNLKDEFPEIFVILGNDDPRINEAVFKDVEKNTALWRYIHDRKVQYGKYTIYGYSIVPPTPFRLKDWEKYDVSRYVDVGSLDPAEGFRSVEPDQDIRYTTILKDIEALTGTDRMTDAVFLFHSPPYKTKLDRAALDGMMVDNVPLDCHVGSIAIKRFIEEKQPWLTMHGHIHESARITGHWKEKIGKTWAFNASTDGPELSVIKFNLEEPGRAERMLIDTTI